MQIYIQLEHHRSNVNDSKVDKNLKIHGVGTWKYQSSWWQWRLKKNAHKPTRALKTALYIFWGKNSVTEMQSSLYKY